jgi:5,10-methylenetetrahydrofolate reductase
MTTLSDKLGWNELLVTVEVDPPRSADIGKTLDRVRRFAEAVDAVNTADCPMANVRMSPIALAYLLVCFDSNPTILGCT